MRSTPETWARLSPAAARWILRYSIARRAARVDGESKRRGEVIPFQDLVIGVTALEFDYAVATANVRHFRMIPGLMVRPL